LSQKEPLVCQKYKWHIISHKQVSLNYNRDINQTVRGYEL